MARRQQGAPLSSLGVAPVSSAAPGIAVMGEEGAAAAGTVRPS